MRNGFNDTLFGSRRDYFDKCRFWKKVDFTNEEYSSIVVVSNDRNKLMHNLREPSGYFYAKPISAENSNSNLIGGTFMFESNSVTLKTNDDISMIQKDDLVEFRGMIYRLVSLQKKLLRMNPSQYSNEAKYSYYLELIR